MTDTRQEARARAEAVSTGSGDGDVLSSRFYAGGQASFSSGAPPREKPQHYKVICISMYTDDLRRLDDMVDALKARGVTRANRSALIRYALSSVDPDAVPKTL